MAITDNIRVTFDELKIEHITVKPYTLNPSLTNIGKFTILDEYSMKQEITFSEQGSGTLQWLWRGKKIDKASEKALSYAKFTDACYTMNDKTKTNSERKIGLSHFMNLYNTLLSVCVDKTELFTLHLRGNCVYGITRKYNIMIDHDEIIKLIEENAYTNKVIAHGFDSKNLFIDLKIVDTDDNYRIRISNGYTGHENLAYKVICSFGNWQFESKKVSKNRHLKNLKFTFDNLNKVMEELAKNNLMNKLNKVSVDDFHKMIITMISNRNSYLTKDLPAGDNRVKLAKMSDKHIDKLSLHFRYFWMNSSLDKSPNDSCVNVYDYISKSTRSLEYGLKNVVDVCMNSILSDLFEE